MLNVIPIKRSSSISLPTVVLYKKNHFKTNTKKMREPLMKNNVLIL